MDLCSALLLWENDRMTKKKEKHLFIYSELGWENITNQSKLIFTINPNKYRKQNAIYLISCWILHLDIHE